jgi:hypothetical protein
MSSEHERVPVTLRPALKVKEVLEKVKQVLKVAGRVSSVSRRRINHGGCKPIPAWPGRTVVLAMNSLVKTNEFLMKFKP